MNSDIYSQEDLDLINRHLSDRNGERELTELPVEIDDLEDEMLYYDHHKEKYTHHHFGQRKLLMNEVDFLTRHGDKSSVVVYAGAAPGNHIPFLSSLFSDHTFYLYDPAKFNYKLMHSENKKIKVFREYFTDEIAKSFAGKNVLFLSDIRTGDEKRSHEDSVHVDNMMQKEWVSLMKPVAVQLKFRIPFNWKDFSYEYLDGEIKLQVWAPIESTETRLELVKGNKMKRNMLYDVQTYEEKMKFFNTVTRDLFSYNYKEWKTREGKKLKMNPRYDCAREYVIWDQYLKKFKNKNLRIVDLFKVASTFSKRPITQK